MNRAEFYHALAVGSVYAIIAGCVIAILILVLSHVPLECLESHIDVVGNVYYTLECEP